MSANTDTNVPTKKKHKKKITPHMKNAFKAQDENSSQAVPHTQPATPIQPATHTQPAPIQPHTQPAHTQPHQPKAQSVPHTQAKPQSIPREQPAIIYSDESDDESDYETTTAQLPTQCPGCYNCNWTGYSTADPERCKQYM